LARRSQEPQRPLPSWAPVAAAAALLLLVVLWFALLRGDGDDATAPDAAPPPPAPAPAPLEPEGGGAGRAGPVETFELFAPRDPFEPLIDEGAASTGTGTGTTPGTGGTSDGLGDGAPGGGDGNGAANGGTTVQGHRVQVIDVFRQGGTTRVQVEVDGTVYTVETGETFAESFQLVSASGRCASFLFGDDQFTLCEGEEILK
jgi:hypothetical protein